MSFDIPKAIKKTILQLFDDLKLVMSSTEEKSDIELAEFFFKRTKASDISNHVVDNILPHSKSIKEKDMDFFIAEADTIFKGMPKRRVDYFINRMSILEKDGGLSQDDKETIWIYLIVLVDLAERYKKMK